MKRIEVINVCKRKNKNMILSNVNFSITANEFCLLIGENGCGKTTLIKSILGLYRVNSGIVKIDDKTFDDKFFLENVGYVPEKEEFTSCNSKKYLIALAKISSKDSVPNIEKRLNELAMMLNVSKCLNKTISKLSSGEKRKFLFISAILHNPSLLILDEPVETIDIIGRKKIYIWLNRFCKENNNSVLLCTHKIDEVIQYATTYLVIDDKRCMKGKINQETKNKLINGKLY